jgi:hypothetical protein
MEKSSEPVLVIEGEQAHLPRWAKAARDLGVDKIEVISAMPMDARHHSKVDRVKLSRLLKG